MKHMCARSVDAITLLMYTIRNRLDDLTTIHDIETVNLVAALLFSESKHYQHKSVRCFFVEQMFWNRRVQLLIECVFLLSRTNRLCKFTGI